MMRKLFISCLVLLTGCGYHFEGGEKVSVSVPYVIGDQDGHLTDTLIAALASTANFRYVSDGGDWTLKAKVKRTDQDRIGFRYGRDDKSGELRTNIVGTENRVTLAVEIEVIDNATDEQVLGPILVKGYADYDYADPNSLQDLSFFDAAGVRQTSIAFSLGQLDTVGAAGRDALDPAYRVIADKVVEGLIAAQWCNCE